MADENTSLHGEATIAPATEGHHIRKEILSSERNSIPEGWEEGQSANLEEK